MPSRRRGKAERDELIKAANNGLLIHNAAGEVVARESAAEVRAGLLRAARIYEAQLIAGQKGTETVEAEAGAILQAQMACEIHDLCEIARAWREANS